MSPRPIPNQITSLKEDVGESSYFHSFEPDWTANTERGNRSVLGCGFPMSLLKAQEFIARDLGSHAAPIVFFVGKDQYWRNRCRKKVLSSWVSNPDDPWSIHRVSLHETNFTAALADARTVPLLCGRQVVIVQAVDALERCGEKDRDEACELLKKYLSDPSPFTFLVLEAESCDQRTRFFRLLWDNALVVELETQEATRVQTVSEMAHAMGCGIDQEGAELLDKLCGDDGGLVEREILKLATYVGERRRITREDVRRLVVASESGSVWDLADTLLEGHVRESLELVERLLLKGEGATKLVGALAWTYRKLIEARDLPESIPTYQAAQRLGMWADSAASFVRKAHKFDRTRAIRGLVLLAEADSLLKSSGVAERTVMEFLVVRLCQNSNVDIVPHKRQN
jgi:DNA polymerase III subunit delta